MSENCTLKYQNLEEILALQSQKIALIKFQCLDILDTLKPTSISEFSKWENSKNFGMLKSHEFSLVDDRLDILDRLFKQNKTLVID